MSLCHCNANVKYTFDFDGWYYRWKALLHELSCQFLNSVTSDTDNHQLRTRGFSHRCIDIHLDCFPFRNSQSSIKEFRAKPVRLYSKSEIFLLIVLLVLEWEFPLHLRHHRIQPDSRENPSGGGSANNRPPGVQSGQCPEWPGGAHLLPGHDGGPPVRPRQHPGGAGEESRGEHDHQRHHHW